MTDAPNTIPTPPPGNTPLPPVVANIWNKFATRELAKGRRDVGHLVEVTLQFVMDQNTKNLAPMVNTLEQLRKWLLAIDKELANMQRALTENPQVTMATPYQRQSIVLDKNGKDGPVVVINAAGQPTKARSDVQSYVATMQKQRELVNQAMQEQTNALQARRDHLAQTLRQYSAELQRSANEMLANAPPVVETPKKVRQKKEQEERAKAAAVVPQRPRQDFASLLLRFKLWLSQFNPVSMVRNWSQALVNGYRADPYILPEAPMDLPAEPESSKTPKKPKVFTI